MLIHLEKLRSEMLLAGLSLEEPDPLKLLPGPFRMYFCFYVFGDFFFFFLVYRFVSLYVFEVNFKSNQNVKKELKIKVTITPTGLDVQTKSSDALVLCKIMYM